ncbi:MULTISPECIES: Zn-ribbon domain-containing OB-fold protein [Paraburkholderia]|uniref:Zn-ribbon domain-containing OB-fold protein n=1 Tax=Paraburkholderia TaxID=1822464 RepID=UPI00038119A3|nr:MULTISPECIES: OB-fold domain-containing protein [Paraburkholderia]MDH6147517.1 putative OB-fold protein [Paraburkholderia sp. WSM4179]
MPTEIADQTSGSGYAQDALPLRDIAEGPRPATFELRHGDVLLRGSQSRSSGSKAFPAREVCMETGARDMEPMLFGPRGTLYSFSTVRVSSTRTTPYTIGYVDFPNGVRVLANLDPSIDLSNFVCDSLVEVRADGDVWFVTPVTAHAGEKA